MKILIVNGHPDPHSYCKAIYDVILENINREVHEVEGLCLGEMKFDPVLRYGYNQFMEPDAEIEESQRLIKWADHYIFIYPIWWGNMPSLLKGWIDRVFTPNVAYSSNKEGNFVINYMLDKQLNKLLKGKTADIYTTSSGPGWWYKMSAYFISFFGSYGISVLRNALLSSCGVKTKGVYILGEMNRENNTEIVRKGYLDKVAKRIGKL